MFDNVWTIKPHVTTLTTVAFKNTELDAPSDPRRWAWPPVVLSNEWITLNQVLNLLRRWLQWIDIKRNYIPAINHPYDWNHLIKMSMSLCMVCWQNDANPNKTTELDCISLCSIWSMKTSLNCAVLSNKCDFPTMLIVLNCYGVEIMNT